ncbi:hypothetical protein P7K49_029435 [Saguinus oedipus]|uniref:Uncharacterized protein n=1 Tax=Saguinus oedipus TaxID=9490 RepID=A0ABQ9U784_SAGOE|nr:hypothetical protein P7K49_029435 [Saguinus oedipus]
MRGSQPRKKEVRGNLNPRRVPSGASPLYCKSHRGHKHAGAAWGKEGLSNKGIRSSVQKKMEVMDNFHFPNDMGAGFIAECFTGMLTHSGGTAGHCPLFSCPSAAYRNNLNFGTQGNLVIHKRSKANVNPIPLEPEKDQCLNWETGIHLGNIGNAGHHHGAYRELGLQTNR